jgi:hypothetical protein
MPPSKTLVNDFVNDLGVYHVTSFVDGIAGLSIE